MEKQFEKPSSNCNTLLSNCTSSHSTPQSNFQYIIVDFNIFSDFVQNTLSSCCSAKQVVTKYYYIGMVIIFHIQCTCCKKKINVFKSSQNVKNKLFDLNERMKTTFNIC